MPIDRVLPWVLRLGWVGVLVLGGAALDGAVAERSDTAAAVARIVGATGWTLGVAAMAIPSVVGLTATRVIAPLSLPTSIVAWVAGADPTDGAVFVGVAALTTVVAFAADLGRGFVQASAYGDEDRHLLRAPPAYLLAAIVVWVVWAGCLLTGVALLAASAWPIGAIAIAVAVPGGLWAWPRWHLLARRWLVMVPAGLVLHDHLVLAETLMMRRHELAALRLAPADTEAVDLTGPAGGHAIEIVTATSLTAIVATSPDLPRGTVIHLTACLVAPTRPGRVLAAATARRLPVG